MWSKQHACLRLGQQNTSVTWLRLALLLMMLMAQSATAKGIKKIEIPQPPEGIEELWLSTQLNQFSKVETLLFLKKANGHLCMLVEDWRRWRLKTASDVFNYQDQDYYELDNLQGVRYQFNAADLSLAIEVDSSWFEPSTFNAAQREQQLTIQSATGTFASYELASNYATSQIDTNLFVDATVFHPLGVIENQVLARHLQNNQRQITRLNTTFVQDNLSQMTTLKIGDMATSALGLSSGLRFAGIQWGTNFALRPKMIRYSLPSISAEALLPSTVDVFINDAKTWTKQVPAGAFTIDEIPISAGKGDAVVIVRDLMGREQRIILPYYANAELLKVGLQEYALDAGVMRQNYGLQSNDYGDWFGMASYRRGLKKYLTGEAQLQWQKQQQLIRLGGVFVVPKLGLLNAWLAQSWYQNSERAYAMGLGFNPQYKVVDFNVDWQYQDQPFTQLGMLAVDNGFKQSLRASSGVSFKQYGSLRAQYASSQNYQQPQSSYLQMGYSLSLGRYGSLTLAMSRALQPTTKDSIQLSLSVPLQNKHTASLIALPLDQQQRLSVQKSVPAGTGFGYNLINETGVVTRNHGTLTWQNPYGSYRFRLAEQEGDYSGDVGVLGSVAYLNGQIFTGRQIDNSFAVAKVADYANVRVYSNNHLIGKTNQQGMLLVPRLLPYQANNIRINASDLPFDAEMTTQELALIPAYKSGVWAAFDVKRAYAATMTIVLDDGQDLPAGAEVYKQDSSEAFPVGYRGELYITGLSAKNILTVEWKGQKCSFEVEFVMVDDSLPDLGRFVCKGVKP